MTTPRRPAATVQTLTRNADAASGQIQIDGVDSPVDVRRPRPRQL